MNQLPFHSDRKLTDVLGEGSFTLSAEVIPPRNGAEQGKVLSQIKALIDAGAEFLAVTKGAGGSLRGGSLPIAQAIKESFRIPCIAHFTCRDLTPHEVENELMDHHYFGIRNILALRGDPPDGQGPWVPKPGGHRYAHELIAQIRDLNQGKYHARQGGPEATQREPTQFCIGAAAYPEHPHEKDRIDFFRAKVEAGAEFGITDLLFDAEKYARFVDLCQKTGVDVPLIPGTRVLKSQKQAAKVMEKFKVGVPSEIFKALPENDSEDGARIGVDLFLELAEKLKRLGAPGIHLFVISDTPSAVRALTRLAALWKHC